VFAWGQTEGCCSLDLGVSARLGSGSDSPVCQLVNWASEFLIFICKMRVIITFASGLL
jgi:hypothetical protein